MLPLPESLFVLYGVRSIGCQPRAVSPYRTSFVQ